MTPFSLQLSGSCLQLTLSGEVTIEHARSLADALRTQLLPEYALAIDASQLTRFDASILQILLACAQKAADTSLVAAAPAWSDTFSRYAAPDPYRIN